MGVVIRFPKCRPLTKLEYREKLRAWYNDPRAWRHRTKSGNPFCWLSPTADPADDYWVQVYPRKGGGWGWGIGKRVQPFLTGPLWGKKTYDTPEIAKKKAWQTALCWCEYDRADALGLRDEDGGDAA
jgi:hypothetical protein